MTDDSQAGFFTLSDLEEAAAKKTDKSAWAYIQGGAGEEWTMKANREAFHRRTLSEIDKSLVNNPM
jgi:isopentenyl diphosphate isomerase/L-lactate dehydrogenase-like FMN-dependent dehydrogenase